MRMLSSFSQGEWRTGTGRKVTLVNATTEEPVAEAGSDGLDWAGMVRMARDVGGPALRQMSFVERGALLRRMADAVVKHRDELLALGMENAGNTRSDAKFDVDGASATLMAYSELCAGLGEARFLVDGEPVVLGRSSRLSGQHIWLPRHGVAVHINAFNFPAWGMAEKAACAFAAGMPIISKPATSTALLAWRLMQVWVEEAQLPPGSLQFIAGGVGDLLSHLGPQDALAFTGSSDTAIKLRGHPQVLAKGVHVNIEADSLNVAVAGPDLERGTPAYDLFIQNVTKEVSQKAGQKCTAIRRIFVAPSLMDAVAEDLVDRLGSLKVGSPR